MNTTDATYRAHRRAITRARAAYEKAKEKAEETRQTLIKAVADAGRDDMGPTELARLSGWSKAYTISIKAGAVSNPPEAVGQ